jgi:periplasmic protein TonB
VSRSSRHKKNPVPIGRTLGVVAAIHVALGAGVFALAQTEVGQRMIKQYKVSLAQEEKPKEKEPPKREEPPPPPPEQKLEAPAPDVAAAPAATAAVTEIGGGGGLAYGGKFAAPSGSGGAVGAFNASVERRFRQYYKEPREEFGAAEVEVDIGAAGEVLTYRLARSSGSQSNDAAILEALAKLQKDGVMRPPKGARQVTVKVTPY